MNWNCDGVDGRLGMEVEVLALGTGFSSSSDGGRDRDKGVLGEEEEEAGAMRGEERRWLDVGCGSFSPLLRGVKDGVSTGA